MTRNMKDLKPAPKEPKMPNKPEAPVPAMPSASPPMANPLSPGLSSQVGAIPTAAPDPAPATLAPSQNSLSAATAYARRK